MSNEGNAGQKIIGVLEGLRDEVEALIERRYPGRSPSFVLTFNLEGTAMACYAIGGDRSIALAALHDLIDRREQAGPDGPIQLPSYIEAQQQVGNDLYEYDVGFMSGAPTLMKLKQAEH
jgi:hypothetical protein